MYSFGDVAIINFPFSDGQGSKRRPVFIIKDTEDTDLLVAKITSQPYATQFDVVLRDWQSAGLTSSSVVRIHKIQTVSAHLVFGRIGRLSPFDQQAVIRALTALLTSI